MISPLREGMLVKDSQLQEVVCTTCFLIPFLDNFLFLFNKVSQVNVLTQAHDCQINGSVFYSANTVSNWLL